MPEVKIDEAAMQAAIATAIMNNVNAEMQKAIFVEAVSSFLFSKDHYSSKTRLSQQFDGALREVAQRLGSQYLDTPEIKEKIDAEVKAALDEILASGEIQKRIKVHLVRAINF